MKKYNEEDKNKILILKIIVIFTILLILATTAFIIFTIINDSDDSPSTSKVVKSTRRTVTTSTTESDYKEEGDVGIIENVETTTTTCTTTTETTTRVALTTNVSVETTSKKISSTTKVKTTTKGTTKTTAPTYDDPYHLDEHIVAIDSTDYEDALDDWEWGIVDLINAERKKNKLREIYVDVNYRIIAENAANLWRGNTSDYVKKYIIDNMPNAYYYRAWNNNMDYNEGYKEYYQDTIAKTNITTDKSYTWMGVGVIYDKKGVNGMPTYYYVIIFE